MAANTADSVQRTRNGPPTWGLGDRLRAILIHLTIKTSILQILTPVPHGVILRHGAVLSHHIQSSLMHLLYNNNRLQREKPRISSLPILRFSAEIHYVASYFKV
jgi:hypothetical protein